MQKQYVRSLFDSIAFRYDLLNHLLSGGIDLYWRRRAVEELRHHMPKRILDVATGTGDFAIAAAVLAPDAIVGVDIAEEMLKRGNAKLRKRGLDALVKLRPGDAEHLDFPDRSFDAAIVAFGVRNFERLDAGLREMLRVLKEGGKIVVLEFSIPRKPFLRQLYLFYFRRILPLVGRWVSRSKQAYRYLPETVMRFPQDEEFLQELRRAGFTHTAARPLTFGIASIYSGIR